MNKVISIKAIISRNLKDYKFSTKLTNDKANEIVELIKNTMPNFMEINQEDKRELVSKDLILNPEKIMLFSKKDEVAITFFESEHISIVSTDSNFSENSFENLKRISQELNNKINFLYNDQYGYLMSDVSKLGAGIQLKCEISLPAINSLGKINQLSSNIKRLGYSLKATDFKDVFEVSTKCNLGLKEQEIYSDFEKIISNIQSIENESLSVLKVDSIDEMIDQTYRAIANLKYAHMINSHELMSLIVRIQTGKNLDLQIDIDEDKMSKLIELAKYYNDQEESKQTMIELSQEIAKVL